MSCSRQCNPSMYIDGPTWLLPLHPTRRLDSPYTPPLRASPPPPPLLKQTPRGLGPDCKYTNKKSNHSKCSRVDSFI